jgi:hypothetical protein
VDEIEMTVLHTTASIRFYERDARLWRLSEKVNVKGTQNVLDTGRATPGRKNDPC